MKNIKDTGATKHTEVVSVPGPLTDETTVVIVPNPQNPPAPPQLPTKPTGIVVLVAIVIAMLTSAWEYFW